MMVFRPARDRDRAELVPARRPQHRGRDHLRGPRRAGGTGILIHGFLSSYLNFVSLAIVILLQIPDSVLQTLLFGYYTPHFVPLA